MHKTGADGARASSERDEGDSQSVMVDNISVSAASSAKGPTSSVQAVTKQEVVQTMSSASSVVDDHLRLMTAGAAELRQMEVVKYHRGFRMPRTESRKFQHAVCLVDPRMRAFTRVSLAFGPASITDPFSVVSDASSVHLERLLDTCRSISERVSALFFCPWH